MNNNINKKSSVKFFLLLLVAILFTGVVGVTYAKFFASFKISQQEANIAKWGKIELREHIVKQNEDGTYYLSDEWVSMKNGSLVSLYTPLEPGVDVLKDPYVCLSGTFEVSFWLYLKIVETNRNSFVPLTYHVDENTWVQYSQTKVKGVTTSIYRYNVNLPLLDAGQTFEEEKIINIFEHNVLHVNTFDIQEFKEYTLKFSAWVEQTQGEK